MADAGKDVDLRAGDPQPDVAPGSSSKLCEGLEPQTRGGRPGRQRNALSEQTRNQIAVQLRAMYDAVAQQPVPERFADLIARLDVNQDNG